MKRTFIVFLTFVFYFSSFTHVYAATPKWVLEYIKVEKQVAEKKRLQALLVKQINESGSLLKTTAVVETVPTASKVGSSMMKRVVAYGKVPGVQMIGVALVAELIEGIGWVMEDGIYVKKKIIEPIDPKDPSKEYIYNLSTFGTSSVDKSNLCSSVENEAWGEGSLYSEKSGSYGEGQCKIKDKDYGTFRLFDISKGPNPNFDPNAEPPKPTERKIPLTAALLGAAMLGTGYKDPVDSNIDSSVNTGEWTGVTHAYTPDPSGTGNELYEALEDKADKAPPTPDNKPAPIGDSRYNNDLSTNDNANDRSWGDEGTKGDSTGSTTTNPETGEQTTNTEFHLPPFCSWAYTVCEWYDKWQKTDTKVNEHLDRTKEHQEEEKGFWQTVKDWFDWSKESPDDEPDTDQPEIDDQGIFSRTFDTVFSLSKECPPDIPFELDTQYLKGSYQISLRWLCIIFTTLGYPLLFASNCLGIWILYEAVIRKEIKVN